MAASVQKRRTLYVPDTDIRVRNGTIYSYANQYYGDLKIIPEAEYIHFMKSQGFAPDEEISLPSDSVEGGAPNLVGDDTEPGEQGQGKLSTALTPPVNMQYDEYSFKLESNSANNTVVVTIVFDESLYNGSPDDNIQYRAFVGPVDPLYAAQDSSAAFDGIKPIDSSTLSVTSQTSSLITLRWRGLSNATGYTIYVKGKNLPKELGTDNTGYVKTASKTYAVTNKLSNGNRYINLKAAAGKPFDGQYSFQISAFYDGHGTSSKVGKVVNV